MRLKILVIEDNEQNMYLMTFLLEKNGFDVIQAREAEQGIVLAAERKPDLILLDIQLPDMDGYTVAKKLRADPVSAGIPIIAVTSYAMLGDREKSLASGCSAHIEKPIDPDTFLDQISGYLPPRSAAEGGRS
jgi:two-component system cell cycle response regulator DivK